MKKKILSFLLASVLAFGSLSSMTYAASTIEWGIRPEDGVTEEQPFAPGTGGSSNFRIPCLTTLDDGTLVAACDARWNHGSDACGLDTIVSYSKDNGKTWNYTFANYLGDNGNQFSYNSTAFIDPAIATDGETVYMIADLYPAGIAINTTPDTHRPLVGSTGFNEDDQLILAKATASVNGLSASSSRISQKFDYHLEKIEDAEDDDEAYYLLVDQNGDEVEGYTIDAYFNIKGNGVNTNLFVGDSPYYPWPADYLYMTKSSDGGKTWSVPTLLNLKKASEQTLLVGPGRGICTSSGRILFTCYEFTSGDKNSACIYSDDGGETWHRSESVSGWSSEAVVTEADGRLYMFTRHGNCYYVSNDDGNTWSSPVSVPKPYNSNCQLTATTYSKKIDGKTAILFAVPSNTGSRSAGKIYVGLVQNNGTLDWAYEYSINGAGNYAYSCITEQSDGSIGLLYESAGTQITYTNLAIEDIVKGAAVGNLWLTDDSGIVSEVEAKPAAEAVYTVNGTKKAIKAVSADESIVAVSVEGNQLTLKTGSEIQGLAETTVTITSGNEEIQIPVYVTAAEKYERVQMSMGQTRTYKDTTGYYVNADLSSLDESVAKVTLTGEAANAVQGFQVQLATSAANYNGEYVSVDDCQYTFTEKTEGQFTVSAEAEDGTKVYLNLGTSGQTPNQKTAANITVLEGNAEHTFKLKDVSFSGGTHLHFYYNNTSKLHFDRCGTSCGAGDEILLYTKSASAPADSPITGYAQVTSLAEVKDGKSYLIVGRAEDGSLYVMHPAYDASAYEYAAKVVDQDQIEAPAEGVTEIRIEAVGEGTTSAVVGETTYFIKVQNEVKEVRLEVGESLILAGEINAMDAGQKILSVEANTDSAPYRAVETIQSGETYLIGSTTHVVTNEKINVSGDPNGLAMKAAKFDKETYTEYLWTVTAANGGYTIEDANGDYLNFTNKSGNQCDVTVGAEAQTVKITNSQKGGFAITDGTYYFNNFRGDSDNVAGWAGDDNAWYFYQSVGYKVTAKAKGTTVITVGGVNYCITVGSDAAVKEGVERLSGKSRYETGFAVAEELKAVLGVDKFEAAIIATGKSSADALSGSYLASVKNAPILLTNGKADNVTALHAYIKENVKAGAKIYVLGGTGAVSAAAADVKGYDVVRLAGSSRYETNLAILKEAGIAGDDLLVATGKDFADSLSASAAARPILLVKPGTALNAEQKALAANFKNIYVIGGTGAVSESIAKELKAFGKVTRLSGAGRYETSIAVAETFFADPEMAVLAYGKNFPDGLCGGPLAAALHAPLVLTKDGGEATAAAYVKANEISAGYVLGGQGVLSDQTVVNVFGLKSAAEIK